MEVVEEEVADIDDEDGEVLLLVVLMPRVDP